MIATDGKKCCISTLQTVKLSVDSQLMDLCLFVAPFGSTPLGLHMISIRRIVEDLGKFLWNDHRGNPGLFNWWPPNEKEA